MSNLLKNIGKEVLFIIAGVIGLCTNLIFDSVGIGFITFALLMVGGVLLGRTFDEQKVNQKANQKANKGQS